MFSLKSFGTLFHGIVFVQQGVVAHILQWYIDSNPELKTLGTVAVYARRMLRRSRQEKNSFIDQLKSAIEFPIAKEMGNTCHCCLERICD
eukprot:1981810-Ditylum_brightwellii.AAC.1